MNKDFLRLTPKAAQYLGDLYKQNSSVIGIYLALKKSGCAGYMYVLDPVNNQPEHVQVFLIDDLTFYVDEESIPHLEGTILDYKLEGLETKAVFINPHVVDACGCGDSVEMKKK